MRYVAMVPIGKSSSFLNCLPVCRGKGVQVVPGGHGGESGEDVPHVGQGIDASALAGYYDRVDDRRTLAGIGMADEEPVFLADGRGSNRVLDQIVVEARLSVLEVPGQGLPVLQEIITRLSHARLREDALPQTQGDLLQPVKLPGIVLFAVPLAVGDRQLLPIPERLAFVEPADDEQDQPGRLRVFPLGLKKPPPRMGPAADPGYLRMVASVAFIGGVHVRLQDAPKSFDERRQLPVTARQPPVEDNVLAGPTDHPQPSFRRSPAFFIRIIAAYRSEERRVGKECRSRWSPYH